jgi:acyl-CoA reductase-like NAD-dependent aldehyde dehydrogenase
MMHELQVKSPIDGNIVARRPLADGAAVAATLAAARKAQRVWRAVPLAARIEIVRRFTSAMRAKKDEIGAELTRQMGRPVRYTPMEVERMCERSEAMMALAPEGLADVMAGAREGFTRFIRKESLGVVLVIAPWNYPFLTAVNAVVPAILAGNAVILKHSSQTPLVAERFAEGFAAAGLPEGVMQELHISHGDTEKLVASDGIDFVAFTGSVVGGHAIQRAAADRFIATGLELGGKDPAYVRADAKLDHSIENLVDGSFFNSGQSCCGIERI